MGSEAKIGGESKEESVEGVREERVKDRIDEREPSWSGFLTWKNTKRVGVDGHSNKVEPDDYAINIVSFIEFKDIVMKEKNVMVL